MTAAETESIPLDEHLMRSSFKVKHQNTQKHPSVPETRYRHISTASRQKRSLPIASPTHTVHTCHQEEATD